MTIPPANARQVWKTWEQAHVVRTIFWMSGFLLEVAGLAWWVKPCGPASVTSHQVTEKRYPWRAPLSRREKANALERVIWLYRAWPRPELAARFEAELDSLLADAVNPRSGPR